MLLPAFISLNYLIVQRYFLILGLCRMLYSPILLILRIFLKLGLPPFHMWFIRIARVLKKEVFIFIMTLHKILPIVFLRKFLMSYQRIVLISSVFLLIGLMLLSRRILFNTVVFSSIVHRIWIALSITLSKGFILFYWMFYSSLLSLLVILFTLPLLKQSYLTQRLLSGKSWLLIYGIPPFIIFWIKVYLLIWLIQRIRLYLILVVILIRMFALTAYYRTWQFGRLLEYRTISIKVLSPFIAVLGFWVIFS